MFPFESRIGNTGQTHSLWCCEKTHSMTHCGENVEEVGHSKSITCQVTESTYKGVKIKGHLTNKKAGKVGFSMMDGVVRDLAAAAMAQKQDLQGEMWTVQRRDRSNMTLRASREWESSKARGASGCMADAFRFNIWWRALKLAGSTQELVGAGRARQGASGYCVISCLDLLPQESRYIICFLPIHQHDDIPWYIHNTYIIHT